MPWADFSRSLDVPAPPERCWPVLIDVDRVAGWVSIVGDVKELEPLSSYEAVLEDRLGPFTLRADLAVQVVELEEGSKVRFRAQGEDRQVGTHLTVEAELRLEPRESGTTLAVSGRYGVIGTVATMGAGTIRKKADAILEEFFSAAERELSAL